MDVPYAVAPDVTFQLRKGGVLASNHRARSHVWLNLALFTALAGERQGPDVPLQASDWSRFSSADGLLADPTCVDDQAATAATAFSSLEDAMAFLTKRWIVCRDAESYREYFAPKRSLVDHKHFGTFHQRLGGELFLRHKTDPATWWYRQKFDPRTGVVRENLYRFIQEHFLQRYFDGLDFHGKTVLDFGCGSGMASQLFVDRGATVIGVDPDAQLLERATTALGESFSPVRLRLEKDDCLSDLPDTPVDFLWLQDVFLFYFYPQDGKPSSIAPATLLSALTKPLRTSCPCVIMQPHGVFWLAPWLGEAEKPYTVLTEYGEKLYSVAPGLEELSRAIARAGLAIRGIYEPKPAAEGRAVDPRAYHFAMHFPQWWVFECLKL